MTKPVGYYTNYTPFDGTLLDEMVNYFGSQFEKMSPTETCWLIYRIGYYLWFHECSGGGISDDVESALNRIEIELTVGDKLGLIEAITNQLKSVAKQL